MNFHDSVNCHNYFFKDSNLSSSILLSIIHTHIHKKLYQLIHYI